jgi:MinD superfamily P-loop ATPase
MCRFGAVSLVDSRPRIDPFKCEGCKVCVAFCPHDAIGFPLTHCGDWYLSETRFGWMVHAQLFPAEENSGKLVALLRQKAKELAKQKRLSLILSDGPPGIGCPVISSLSGASFAVIVTEPTPSGCHDLERVSDLCRHFRVPAGIVINKSDINDANTRRIQAYCQENGFALLGKIPHDPVVTQAIINGRTITEYQSNGIAACVRRIWMNIENVVMTRASA